MGKSSPKPIVRKTIDTITLIGSYENRTFVQLNYFENSDVWQVTDVHGGWCGTYLFSPKEKNHKIKAFRRWILERKLIKDLNITRTAN